MNAPHPEPEGYRSEPSFCKSNPLNNEHYIEQMKNDPWYPIIQWTDTQLAELVPGYNIVQIKEKFNGLRYYIDRGSCDHETWDAKREEAHQIVLRAEVWVDGFEAGRRLEREKS